MALRYIRTRGDIGSQAKSSSICTACNEPLNEITYQARSADEPARSIILCLRCPLNPGKLSAGGSGSTVDYGQSHPLPPARPRFSRALAHRRGNTAWILSMNTMSGDAVLEAIGDTEFSTVRFTRLLCTCSDDVEAGPRAELVDVSNGEYARTLRQWDIAPGIVLREVVHYEVPDFEESFWTTTTQIARNANLHGIQVTIEAQNNSVYSLRSESSAIDNDVVYKFISAAYFAGAGPQGLDTCWGFGKVRSLMCARPRSHDSVSASNETHLFTTKPDGQRCIVARLGCIWGYFRSDNSARFIGWTFGSLSSGLNFAGRVGAVIDVELIAGGLPIFIDLLQRDDSSLIEGARQIRGSLSEARALPDIMNAITFREYFSTVEEAMRYRDEVKYPCDGLVAIHTEGVEMKKLKDVRSIEVLHVGGGITTTANGIPFFSHPSLAVHPEGSIVELRVVASLRTVDDVRSVEIVCTDSFVRTDKEVANSTKVCVEIVRVALGPTATSSLVRRHVVLWCRDLSLWVLRAAFQAPSQGHFILDLGAGDGQVAGLYAKAVPTPKSVGVLMVESNASSANSLYHSLRGKTKYVSNYEDLALSLAKLRNRELEYLVFHGDANALVNQEQLYRLIRPGIKCAIASFSISHVLPALQQLASDGVACVGCGYLYDGVDAGECLVDAEDICMKRISDNEATVKWGRDSEYRERAIVAADFNYPYRVERGSTVVPLQMGGDEADIVQTCRSICSNVYVVRYKC